MESDNLSKILKTLSEETTSDGHLKFSGKTIRDISQAIVCRTYGKSCLELAYLLIIASACERRGGSFLDLFYNSGVARPSAFKGYIQSCKNLPDGIRPVGNGVVVTRETEDFTVTFGRMPYLSAFLEFLLTSIGYTAVHEHVSNFCGQVPSRASISESANGLSRCLYHYLREHLPTAHDQSKSYLLANFIKERIGQNCSPNDINNSALLDFWLEQSSDKNESNFKLFSSVFKVGIELRKAISHRLEKLKFENASSLGKDKEAGEVDPDKIEEIVVAVENDTQPLRALAETPLNTIKFLNGRETETAEEVCHGPEISVALSHSVFRNAVFGQAQNRITNALRHKRLTCDLLQNSGSTNYLDKLKIYRDLSCSFDRSLLAVLHVLLMARRPEAIELAMAIRPNIDFGELAEIDAQEPEWADLSLVNISAERARKRFFDYANNNSNVSNPLANLFSDARKAFSNNSRQGFNADQIDDELSVDNFADAVSSLIKVRRDLVAFVNFAEKREWSQKFTKDSLVFSQHFKFLYGGSNDNG